MAKAVNQREEQLAAKRQAEVNLEIQNRSAIGAQDLPASKSSQESAKLGALKSNDPTAIAAAQGNPPLPQPQINLADVQALQGQITQSQQPQQPTISTQPPLRIDQQIARAGLAIPTAIGNTITAGLEKVTGQKYGRTSAADLAQTGVGEALGLGIVGTAVAALGTFAFSEHLASLSAQELIDLSAERAAPTAIRSKAFSILGQHKLLTFIGVGGIAHVSRTVRKDAKAAIVSSQATISDILTDVSTGRLSYTDAKNQLDEIGLGISSLESKGKLIGLADLTYWLSQGHDDAVDIANTKRKLVDAYLLLPQAAATNLRTPTK